jgi:hypothetical protein
MLNAWCAKHSTHIIHQPPRFNRGGFLSSENPTLGVGFRGAYSDAYERKLLLLK